METKDFMELLDLNKDSQVGKEDVKILWEFLNKENPKYNKEFVEKMEKDSKFKEVLFALEPSFLGIINSKDFVINAENKENIIILQFFAKYFRWENVEINGQFTPEIEKLYLESSLQTKSLDQNTFSWNSELENFKTWVWMNDSITIQTISREEFDKIKPNITEKNNLKWDWKDKPQGYNLKIPEDLKNTETPMIMKAVNQIAYWEKLPEQSAFKTYQSKLEANIKYLETIENEASQNPDTKVQYDKLMWKLEQLKNNNYDGDGEVDNNIVENEFWSIEWKMSLEFQEIDNGQIKWQKDNPKVKMMLLEKMISKDLKNYTDLAVFERWTETLFDYLTTPTKKQHEYLLDEGKRKEAWVEESDPFIKQKLESISDVKQKLKDSIWVEKYRNELGGLEWEQRISKEKEVCQKILEKIFLYPRTPMWTSENAQPTKMLETQKMVCVGKSIIAWWFLQELWIKYDALNVWWHSALMVYLSDGKEYYFDPTNATDLSEFENKQKIEWWTYEKWKVILVNKFAKWWKMELWANTVFTDGDWNMHFSKATPELWLMWQMYNSKWHESNLGIEKEITLLQRGLEINPNFIELYNNLALKYTTIWNYDEAIKVLEKWLKIDKENSILLGNIWAVVSIISDFNIEKSLEIWKDFLKINPSNIQLTEKISKIIYKDYIKKWNIEKWYEELEKIMPISLKDNNLMNCYWEIIKSFIEKWNYSKAYELAEKWLSYREDAFCLDILAKKEIDSWDYEKASDFLWRAWKIAVSQDTITRTIHYLKLLQSRVNWNQSILDSVENISEWISGDLEQSINNNINNKNFEEARGLINELIEVKPWFWYYKLWYIGSLENKKDEIVKNYKKAIELAPDDKKEAIKKELDSITH